MRWNLKEAGCGNRLTTGKTLVDEQKSNISYQLEILDILTELNYKKKTTICMVLHDMNLTAKYADYIFAMKDGKVIKEGSTRDMITPKLLYEVFGINSEVINDPVSDTPLIISIGRYHIKKRKVG